MPNAFAASGLPLEGVASSQITTVKGAKHNSQMHRDIRKTPVGEALVTTTIGRCYHTECGVQSKFLREMARFRVRCLWRIHTSIPMRSVALLSRTLRPYDT